MVGGILQGVSGIVSSSMGNPYYGHNNNFGNINYGPINAWGTHGSQWLVGRRKRDTTKDSKNYNCDQCTKGHSILCTSGQCSCICKPFKILPANSAPIHFVSSVSNNQESGSVSNVGVSIPNPNGSFSFSNAGVSITDTNGGIFINGNGYGWTMADKNGNIINIGR